VIASLHDRAALRGLIEERLKDSRPPVQGDAVLPAGFSAQIDASVRQYFPPAPAAAAVLIPIIDREEGLTVLLTQRASHLRRHAGQISFPGGRVEPTDEGAFAAALRETEEEIGLSRHYVRFVGYLEPQLVLTGYWITPIVAFVQPGFTLKLDGSEVESTFEAPLAHVLDASNHRLRERLIGAASVPMYEIPYGPHQIWGATARMLVALYQLLSKRA
jgi:8-oxo-dGTP pyrophosphatase MutT (NUDIX family)